MDINELIENFEFLGDWEERYRYIIELGRKLPDFDPAQRTEENKVRGCQSQVWLVTDENPENSDLLYFRADSDAHIVRGLLAILLMMFTGKNASAILAVDAKDIFAKLGLDQHLSPSRTNGLNAMVQRVRAIASTRAPQS